MNRIFSILMMVLIGTVIYISCSEDSTSSQEDASVDTEQKDVIEIKDGVSISDIVDISKDNIEEAEDSTIDEGVEPLADTEPDVIISEDNFSDIGTDDVITDTNPSPPAKIIPGLGIDIIYNANPRQIRIDDKYLILKDITTSVPNQDVPFYLRVDELKFDMLFVDTDGSKSLSDNDKLVRIILSKDFDGETEGHTKAGDDISKAKTEFGNSDNTATANVEGKDYTFDFWFKKGVNVGSDNSGKITGFTIYKAQKVVPSTDIDYEKFSTLEITADLALLGGGATSISDMRNKLGPEDLLTEDSTNKVNYYTYLSIGASFIESQSLSGKVVTISVFPPFFGKIKGTSLSLGSTKSEIETFFTPKYGQAKTTQQGNITIYYYPITTKNMGIANYDYSLGFIYNQNDKVSSILIGLPVKK